MAHFWAFRDNQEKLNYRAIRQQCFLIICLLTYIVNKTSVTCIHSNINVYLGIFLLPIPIGSKQYTIYVDEGYQ